MSDVRQEDVQKPDEGAVPAKVPTSSPNPAAAAKAEDDVFSFLDVLRTSIFLLLTCMAVSWLINRDVSWGLQRPDFMRYDVIKTWISGPQQFTDADLAAYDGTDPEKPIYLAINGTIYDVSNGRKHYGPKGSYHYFAGADASRGFVTNCFKEDRTPDMRGVEEMFIPLDNPEIDSLYTSGQLKSLKEQERRKAKEQVHQALKHWVDFFENSKKYTKIGTVKRKSGWETQGPAPTLCKRAQESRPTARQPPPKE